MFFWLIASFFILVGGTAGGWYLFHRFTGEGAGHIQSAMLAAASITIGLIAFLIGFVADLQAVNRRLLEGIDWRLRQLEDSAHRRQAASVPRDEESVA